MPFLIVRKLTRQALLYSRKRETRSEKRIVSLLWNAKHYILFVKRHHYPPPFTTLRYILLGRVFQIKIISSKYLVKEKVVKVNCLLLAAESFCRLCSLHKVWDSSSIVKADQYHLPIISISNIGPYIMFAINSISFKM